MGFLNNYELDGSRAVSRVAADARIPSRPQMPHLGAARSFQDALFSSFSQSPFLMLLILALGVICIRLPFFDYSVLSADESVYLMIGAGMRNGLTPYVDIVDRKPIGIFLIFGASDFLFKDPIIGVFIIGVLSTLMASWLLARIGITAS